jgi:hypothetical protein
MEHQQIHPASLQRGGQLDQMLRRTTQPIKLGDDELVAGAIRRKQRPVQLGAAAQFPRRDIDENLLAAGSAQRVVLGLGMLVAGDRKLRESGSVRYGTLPAAQPDHEPLTRI